jgi:hypothetical protein
MRQVLDAGRSSILLVPEIGLTPAVAADLHQVFGDEVAILHSGLSIKSGRSSGIAYGAARRGWWPGRGRRCSLRSAIWR